MPGPKSHSKRHPIDNLKDHSPVVGTVGGNIVIIDPVTKLPIKDSGSSLSSILGGLVPQGIWDASSNTPTLADGTGTLGHFYLVSVAGTQDLGSGSQTFNVNDWVLYDQNNDWKRVDNSDPTHDGLLHLAWSLAGHVMDTDLDMANYKIENCKHIGVYHVSDILGSDGAGVDGDEDNPFKTAQAAFDYAKSVFAQVIILIIDSNAFNQYSLSIPNLSPPTSICSVEAMLMAWDSFSVIEVGSNNIVTIDNLSVTKLKEGVSSNLTDVIVEECLIGTLLNNAETGPPANWEMTFADTLMNTVAITNALAMGSRARGSLLDNQTDKSYNLTEMSMNSKKITDLANGVGAQDGMALNQRYTDAEAGTVADGKIVTHTAIPAAHHAKYTDPEAVTAMGAKGDGNPLNHDKTTELEGTAIKSTGETGASKFLREDGDDSSSWQDAPPPLSGIVEGTSQITIATTTRTLATGMTVTPPSGTYLVTFSGLIGTGGDDRWVESMIFSGGVVVAASVRRQEIRRNSGSATENRRSFCCQARVSVNGAEAIEGRWARETGTGYMFERQLSYVKVS